MKTKILCAAVMVFTGLFFTACGNRNQNTLKNDHVSLMDEHTSKNSLDYAGTYVGTLPCADCSGIRTEITINKDGNYTMVTVYEGKGNESENTYRDSGRYEWNSDGNSITLSNDNTMQYQVGENTLIALDMYGNKITGELADKYILRKR